MTLNSLLLFCLVLPLIVFKKILLFGPFFSFFLPLIIAMASYIQVLIIVYNLSCHPISFQLHQFDLW